MKLVIKEKDKKRVNRLFDWILHMIFYAIILILMSILVGEPYFKIDYEFFGVWAFLSSVIIYILNKTVRPIIFHLTLPITGITLGLFYPFINVIILHITSFFTFGKFEVNGILLVFFVAIMISVMNSIVENIIIKNILKRSVV